MGGVLGVAFWTTTTVGVTGGVGVESSLRGDIRNEWCMEIG